MHNGVYFRYGPCRSVLRLSLPCFRRSFGALPELSGDEAGESRIVTNGTSTFAERSAAESTGSGKLQAVPGFGKANFYLIPGASAQGAMNCPLEIFRADFFFRCDNANITVKRGLLFGLFNVQFLPPPLSGSRDRRRFFPFAPPLPNEKPSDAPA